MSTFPFDIVGFDLDGTLLDTHEDLAAAVNHALSLESRDPVPAADVRDLIGGGARRMLERALQITGGPVPDDRFEEMHQALLAYYEAHIAVHSRLFPGGEDMLDALIREGVRLAVVTNKREHLAVKLLDQLDLTARFFTVIGGDTLGPGRAKPKPDMLIELLDRAGGGRAAFVGDTTYDTGAARAAKLPCVAVRFGFCDRPADELGASVVIDRYDELIPALRTL